MEILEKIIDAYPEIIREENFLKLGINLHDDGDGVVYLKEWTYSKPIPQGIKLGK